MINKDTQEKKEKRYYLVEVEALIPTILRYRVLAETAENALDLIKTAPLLEPPKQKLSKLKKLKASVYLFGTHMLKLTKKF